MITSLVLLLVVSATTPEVVFSGQRVALTPVADPVVVRSTDHEAIARRLTTAHTERILGRWTLIEGSPAAAAELVAKGEASEVLAVYETDAGQRLFADRHVLVRFAASVDQASVLRLVAGAGGSQPQVRNTERNEWDVLAASPAEAVELSAQLRGLARVVWSHPDFIARAQLASVPNDPLYASQYHHAILNSAAAWDITRGLASTKIAILDSGTDLSHVEFANKITDPYDFLDNDNDPNPARNDAHGTACSGIATAIADNGVGIAGVCPNCSLMPVRMLDENGLTRQGGAAQAVTWSITHGARTISCSWSLSPVPDTLSDAIAAADTAGAVILYASGNSATTIKDTDIAANAHVHAVGATDEYDLVASYSNTGSHLFITAPSPAVVTDITDSPGYSGTSYYVSFAGTSGSTPVVAGLTGLLLSQRSDLTNSEVIDILSSTADKVGDEAYVAGRNDTYGAGRVNAYRALLVAANMTPCTPAQEICDNGEDEDCDGLIDELDPQCAPADLPVGVTCTQDFQCSTSGFCLTESLGYPGGYCSASCSGSGASDCPDNAVCIGEGFATGSQCHLSCASDDDCRSGYWCRTFDDGAKACVPSCETSACLEGETCDSVTKACTHAGASKVGGACTTRVDCEANGRCLTSESGYHGGFCVSECQDTGVCPSGSTCYALAAGTAFCLPDCSVAADCRDFYACYPVTGETVGYCFSACLSDEDCSSGDTCNSYGLCGDEAPPGESSSGGSTSSGSSDSSDTSDDGGCAAAGAAPLTALIVALLTRRKLRSTQP